MLKHKQYSCVPMASFVIALLFVNPIPYFQSLKFQFNSVQLKILNRIVRNSRLKNKQHAWNTWKCIDNSIINGISASMKIKIDKHRLGWLQAGAWNPLWVPSLCEIRANRVHSGIFHSAFWSGEQFYGSLCAKVGKRWAEFILNNKSISYSSQLICICLNDHLNFNQMVVFSLTATSTANAVASVCFVLRLHLDMGDFGYSFLFAIELLFFAISIS